MLRKFAEGTETEEYQLAKLERMQQFAEALSCRRKALLGYFGEHISDDCGNCDICKTPPKYFDGTLIAQKVCSAVTRSEEHTSELQSRPHLVCRLLLEKKKNKQNTMRYRHNSHL